MQRNFNTIRLNDGQPFLPPPQPRVSEIVAQGRGLVAGQVGIEAVLFVKRNLVRETY